MSDEVTETLVQQHNRHQAWLVEHEAKRAYRKERDAQRRAAKESPWPPEPGDHGYDQMREWLSHHVNILTGEPDGLPE